MFYHGSNHKIEKFIDDFVGGQRAVDSDGPGIYFSSEWDDARQFGNIIYTVNLSPRKIVYDKPGKLPQKDLVWLIKNSGDWKSKAQNWDENPLIGLAKSIEAIYEYHETPFGQLLQVYKEYYKDSIQFIRNASRLKYDAIFIEKEWGATHVVVMNPEIIELLKVEDDRAEEEKQLHEIRKLVRKTLSEGLESNLNDNFKNWFAGSKVVDKHGNPLPVHHGTAKKFSKFNLKNAPQPIIWFTSNKGAVEAGDVGAAGRGHIMDLYASIKNPAGWNEYEKYGLGQLHSMGYDGAILPDPDGTFTGFVFEPTQLKSVVNKGEWNPNDKNIFKENTDEIESRDIILDNDLIVYHGADESNIKALEKGFNILSPEEKMKLPSTGGGYFGFSATVNIDRAAKYSSVFGSKVVIELKILKGAKIKGIHNNGKAIDEVLTQEQMEEYSLNGYDAVMELEEGGEEEVRILTSSKVKVLKVISLDKNIHEDDSRKLGKSLASQTSNPFVVIYRAAPMTANEFFDRDYVTLSKKFAIEHAENNNVYHEEPFHVLQALVPTKDVYDAYNPGEYFYSGPNKKGKEIYVSKGEDYEGLDETRNNLDDKYASCHTSDLIRMDMIEEFFKSVEEDPEYNTEEPDYDMLLDPYDGYGQQTYIQNDLAHGRVIFREGWSSLCWEGLYAKPEYKGLGKEAAIKKIFKERIPRIAEEFNMTVEKADYYFHITSDELADDGYIMKIVFKKNDSTLKEFAKNKTKSITDVINHFIKKYTKKHTCTTWDINNGLCSDFANDVIAAMGDKGYELTDDMFFNTRDLEFARENWGEVIETKYGVWSKKMLDLYGYPSVPLENIKEEASHAWIFYNGKHYDAEAPQGVDKWYDLPLMKKWLSEFERNETLNEIHSREKAFEEEIVQVAKQLNIKLDKFIGAGAHGVTYEIPGNKVLKITIHANEVNNSKRLAKKKNEYLVNIDKVYSIKKNHHTVIVMEKLQPLGPWKKRLKDFNEAVSRYYGQFLWSKSGGLWDHDDEFGKQLPPNLVPVFHDIVNIFSEARQKGVELKDVRIDNLGLKNGHLAAFDLG